jgi:DNA-directed RNA polymerase specialized sigma24 family protein
MQFRGPARAFLRRKFARLAHIHEDLISEALLGVATHLGEARPPGAPSGWFGTDDPPEEDQARFRALCFAILSRRVNDHFRSKVSRWLERSHQLAEEQDVPSPHPEPDAALDLRRAVSGVLSAIDALSRGDQLLLERAIFSDSLGPMVPSDRQRLHRLRSRLTERLTTRLGTNPLELIRRA